MTELSGHPSALRVLPQASVGRPLGWFRDRRRNGRAESGRKIAGRLGAAVRAADDPGTSVIVGLGASAEKFDDEGAGAATLTVLSVAVEVPGPPAPTVIPVGE